MQATLALDACQGWVGFGCRLGTTVEIERGWPRWHDYWDVNTDSSARARWRASIRACVCIRVSMHVCMGVSMHVCMRISTHVFMRVSTHVFMRVSMRVCMHVCIRVITHVCMRVSTHVCMRVSMRVCIRVSMRVCGTYCVDVHVQARMFAGLPLGGGQELCLAGLPLLQCLPFPPLLCVTDVQVRVWRASRRARGGGVCFWGREGSHWGEFSAVCKGRQVKQAPTSVSGGNQVQRARRQQE